MALENAGKNVMLDALGVVATYFSLHDGFPATIGPGNECTGGTPAYARKATDWNAAATGSMTNDFGTTPAVFDIASGETVDAIGICSALTGGTIYGGADVTTEGAYGAQGTYTIDTFTVSIT